ncbi:MAG: hypothetical protein HQM10_23785 [Candidatus Riflebacteria bacterium]|nr:hypothetical protein [Candidatus Riflebacteria bacterium]
MSTPKLESNRLFGSKLFGKIFLWFWFTVILTGISVNLVTYFFQISPFNKHFKEMECEFLKAQAHLIVSSIEQSDKKELLILEKAFGHRLPWIFSEQAEILFKPGRSMNNFDFLSKIESEKFSEKIKEAVKKIVSSGSACIIEPSIAITDEKSDDFTLLHYKSESGKNYFLIQPHPGSKFFEKIIFIFLKPQVLITFLVISTILCFILARHLSSPAIELKRFTHQFSMGELQTRLSDSLLKRYDEFGELANNFNEMAERISSMIERQKRLLRDISHELRSPLARMQVALELARKTAKTEPLPHLARINIEADRIEAMIQELLTLFRLEECLYEDNKSNFDIVQVVNHIVSDARFEDINNPDRILWNPAETTLYVPGSEKMIGRAIENIIRNAVKFSSNSGKIEITMFVANSVSDDATQVSTKRPASESVNLSSNETREKVVVLEVSDRGPGIPDEKINDVFTPFFRCDEDRSRSTGGTGLGLAISKRAIERDNGRIRLRNRENGGLTVEIILPVAHS